jgi:small subunit ribosomal protein S18
MADETNSIPAAAPAAASTSEAPAGTPSTGERSGGSSFSGGERAPRPAGSGYQGQGGGQGGPRTGGARPPRPGGPGGGPGGRKFFRRKKVCKFTVEKIDHISYRDVRLLQGFISDRGKIIPRRLTGTSAPFQRKLTRAIKQARAIALLPYASRF